MSEDVDQVNTGCLRKIQVGLREFLSWIRTDNAIHPSGIVPPDYSEFIVINSKIRLRCIHLNPASLKKSKILEFQNELVKNKRHSLSEEYWFTKWNKHLRTGICSCSFRRSLRHSQISSQNAIIHQPLSVSKEIVDAPRKITDVESFIERLICDTFFEAFQEYYVISSRKNSSIGVVNLAFTLSEEVQQNSDVEVELRNRQDSARNKDDSAQCKHARAKKQKPLVLLFHGMGTSADIWWLVIRSLVANGYEIVAPDMLGHGYSSNPHRKKAYTFRNLLLHALAIFDNYVSSNDQKCILIGHSYGCSFATAIYHQRMGRVSQIILIAGGGPTPLAPPVDKPEMIHSECVQILVQPLIFCGVNRSLFYSSRGKFFDINEDSAGVPQHVLDSVRMGQSWPEGDATFHRRIFAPTLLIHGLQDKYITLVQECEMERTIPRSFLELIPNAGHMPMIETPEHLTHMILCFLDCWS